MRVAGELRERASLLADAAAVLDAARAIRCGEGELFVAGGVESMSRAPFAVLKAESAFGREFKVDDTTLGVWRGKVTGLAHRVAIDESGNLSGSSTFNFRKPR